MEETLYPNADIVTLRLDKLLKTADPKPLSERMSSRMVRCASALEQGGYVGWQMNIPKKGLVEISLFGTAPLHRSDLEWIAERTGKPARTTSRKRVDDSLSYLHELYLPIPEKGRSMFSIGFESKTQKDSRGNLTRWPAFFSSQFQELVCVLQKTGGVLRLTAGSASEEEQELCRKAALSTYDIKDIDVADYIGRPVKVRALMRLPCETSVRLKTILEEAVRGAKLEFVGRMEDQETRNTWEHPLTDAPVLPDYAARILILEPELRDTVIGIESCEEPARIIPAAHKNAKDPKAVLVGQAMDTSGYRRKVTIANMDLRRHYQIVGQTGTGKSTLLSNLIISAIESGHGLTFFDPHGSTIDVILHTLPEKFADRVRVVHIGDANHPIPLNIWDSDDPVKEERNISDICELFSDIFDPRREGFVGPRYERWLSTFAKASIAFLGHRASLESISVISQSQDNMLKLCKAIKDQYPELVDSIKEEYGLDKSNDFHQTLSWYLCKFQRLTSVEQLRKTLGAGANALDFSHTIDTDIVTLIDLATPTIGSHAARIVGTLILMKLWNAAMERKERDKTHLVIVDEAALFQTNPMPRMLAESRKFGISMILCSQYLSQFTSEIRDALEANSANFSAFRLSPKDAAVAAIRLDDPAMQVALTRLNAFNAVTTLSVNGHQTAPFTLEVRRPKLQTNGDVIAERIEANSLATLSKATCTDIC